MSSLRTVLTLCDDITDRQLARGRVPSWSWGPAMFGFALTELDEVSAPRDGRPRYETWERAYADHWVRRNPRIDQSDRSAPGLITDVLAVRTGDPTYARLTDRVAHYIRTEPRLIGDAVNHLGPSMIGRIYPRSVWVDSLMMFGVFAARWGRRHNDQKMVDLAAGQPMAYADLLQDPMTALWAHSWWQRKGGPYPQGLYWGRGNGWVMAALPMILEAVGLNHPRACEIVDILQRTSDALVPHQAADGTFDTLVTEPSYREMSATALIASGWFHGVRLGVLSEELVDPARSALGAVTGAVRRRNGRWELPEISGPTIPLPIFPRTGYRLVRRGVNHSYGVAAYGLAAVNSFRLLG